MNIQLFLISFYHIFNDGFQAAFLLLLPFIAKDLHISLTQIGLLGSVLGLFETLLALPMGYIGEKFNGFKILLLLMFLFALGFCSLWGVTSFLTLFIPFTLIGIGYGAFHPIGFTLAAQLAKKEERGQTVGDFTAVGEFGRTIFPAVATFLAAYIGWRYTSFAYGAIAFIVCLTAYVFLRKNSVTSHVAHGINKAIRFADLLKNRKYLSAVTITFFDSFASSSLSLFLPFLLLKKGIAPSILGSFAAAFFIGNLLGKSVVGRLADKYQNSLVFIITEFFMAILIFVLVLVQSPWLVVVVSIALGIMTKGTIPARVSMIIESTEHHGRFEKAISLNAFVASIGSSLSPIIYGRIADLWGIHATFYTSAIFAFLAIIPAGVYFFMKRKV